MIRRDERAVSPVVGKALEATLVVLFITLLSAALYGNVVPEYRTAAGSEVADRTLSGAAERIEATVPPAAREVRVTRTVDLPRTIAGDQYRLRVDGETLVLDHPDPEIGGRSRLALPERVVRVRGTWESAGDPAIRIRTVPGGVEVVLRS